MTIEKWGLLELSFRGTSEGNPYIERQLNAVFTGEHETVRVTGFYDGEGVYKARFMPRHEGRYTYEITGNYGGAPARGEVTVTAPQPDNHGPVGVWNKRHFRYADGTPYYPVGTTCYNWVLQDDETTARALDTFGQGHFNKVRFVLWRHGMKLLSFEETENAYFPFATQPGDNGLSFDFERFDPTFFRHVERCVAALCRMNLQADVILMTPSDIHRFGFVMSEADLTRYLRYVAARLSAYRNVWWTLSNEHDFIENRALPEWNRYAQTLCISDPYSHMRSIHYWRQVYDYAAPWVTHCCVQSQNFLNVPGHAAYWRERYDKPVVLDEIAYEGNLDTCWGALTGEMMAHSFWMATVSGGYASHGECYVYDREGYRSPHFRTGETLCGSSAARIRFLKGILEQTPGCGLKPKRLYDPIYMPDGVFSWDDPCATPEDPAYEDTYYLVYYGFACPAQKAYHLDDTYDWQVEVIDTWGMTIDRRANVRGAFTVDLPGRPGIAVRLTRLNPAQ